MTIIPASKFESAAVRFGAVEKNKMGGKFVPIVDENGQKYRLTIQTPALALPFGISAYRERPEADVSSYSIDVSFRGMETDPKIAEFLERMKSFDEHMLVSAAKHSKEWYGGKQKSKEILEDSYRRLVKFHAEGVRARDEDQDSDAQREAELQLLRRGQDADHRGRYSQGVHGQGHLRGIAGLVRW